MLKNHPTMRVFLQNVLLNLQTVNDILIHLQDAFRVFQQDITNHRKQMKQKRDSLGYGLDVKKEAIPTYDQSLFDPTPPPEEEEEPEKESNTTTVWGMGKTGANLARMLHAGAFATSLFDPPLGRAQLILITDGALRAQFQDNTLWKQFAEQDVSCHVIQIGFPQSFIPGRNFGFLPDTEIGKFLAQTTGGTFLYSNECVRLTRPAQKPDDYDHHDHHHHHHHHRYHFKFKVKRSLLASDDENNGWWNLNPNIYHRHFILRESNLEKIRTLTPFLFHLPVLTGDERRRDRAMQSFSNFPWDPEGITPPIEWRLLKYRDYALPDDFAHMIAARAREGFYLQSVLFEKSSTFINKTDRIQLTLVFHWKPHVIIEYRIGASWLPGNKTTRNKFYARIHSPRVEIFIRSDAEFAHLLQHAHLIRRRFQMIPQDSEVAMAISKVEKLKTYLQYLVEGDGMLSDLITQDYFSPWDEDHRHVDVAKLKSRFCSFGASRFSTENDRYQTRCWYDLECMNFLSLKETTTNVVEQQLATWADITLVKNDNQERNQQKEEVTALASYVKFLGIEDIAVDYTRFQQYPSFCKIKIQHEYGNLVTLRCLFFNATPVIRQKVKSQLKIFLSSSVLFCARPFSNLLIRDQDHFVTLKENVECREEKETKKKRAWYMPVGLWLTGKHIVHDYLWCARWSWRTKINHINPPVHDLAFCFLSQARIEQGYQLVLAQRDIIHFYKEVDTHQGCVSALQYFIQKDQDGRISTELWLEPSVGRQYNVNSKVDYNNILEWTAKQDKKIISHLVTFDHILSHGGAGVSELFNVSLVLKLNPFMLISYDLPTSFETADEFYPYFKASVKMAMDDEINLSPTSDIWRDLMNTLQPGKRTLARDLLCFAHIIDSQRFFLMVILSHIEKNCRRLDCLVFTCKRLDTTDAPVLLETLKEDNQVEMTVMDNISYGSFSPSRLKSCFMQDLVLDKVKMMYDQAFLTSIHAALSLKQQQAKKSIWVEDLKKALAVCRTTIIPLDLTIFVTTLKDTPAVDNTIEMEMERKWQLVLNTYFERITMISPNEENVPANVLLHLPPLTNHCLFLGLSCSFDDGSTIAIQDPTCFTEIKSIMFRQVSSTILLNLICSSANEGDQMLSPETITGLDWMFTEQVIHQHLRSSPVQKDALQYVETQLNKHSTSQTEEIPLRFVFAKKGQQVFMEILARTDQINRMDHYFYVAGTTDYWLLLVAHEHHVQLYYYAFIEQEDKNIVVERMKQRIHQIEKQVNQTLLLIRLQETRSCSDYLEPPKQVGAPTSNGSDSDSSQHSNNLDNEPEFKVGECQCPQIYHHTFAVHWRVPSGKALSYLKNNVLCPFLVTNRAHMYVFERENTVVYCKFNENKSSNALEMSVYGLSCPDWIKCDVVPLIENRLTAEVTLVELQTFFARNPSSKPTLSDVDFIFPFGTQSSHTMNLCLPMSTDLPKLIQFFKRFLMDHSLRPFQGPQVVAALDTHFKFTTNPREDQLEKDELCFYYNCTKRIPGISSAMEVSCGQGMAGIIMTIRDNHHHAILTTLPFSDNDPQDIRQLVALAPDRYVLQVDVWTRGAVDGQVLLQHIQSCYQHAICDTLIEQTVRSTAREFKKNQCIDTVIFLLEKSITWCNPTVHIMQDCVDPWCMADVVQALKDKLIQIDPSLEPTVMWRKWNDDNSNDDEDWLLYRSSISSNSSIRDTNVQMISISGLSQLIGQFTGGGLWKHRPSLNSLSSSRSNSISAQGSYQQPPSTASSLRSVTRKPLQTRPQTRSVSSISSTDSNSSITMALYDEEDALIHPLGDGAPFQLDTDKSWFLIMLLDPDHLTMYTYNWTECRRTRLFQQMTTCFQYQRMRARFLDNILHQKMGLFHHSLSIQSIADQFLVSSFTDESTNLGSSGAKIITSPPPSATSMSVQHIIRNTQPSSSPLKKESSSGSNLCERQADLLSMANPDLNHVLLTTISDPVVSRRQQDELCRHGEPFLSAYLQQATWTSVHYKARQVYTKWRETAKQKVEGLSRYEVAEILRSSRLLHFCRAPFFLFTADKNDHHHLAQTFVAKYACYLEKLNMQRVVLEEDESDLRKKIKYPSTYLLKVFDAGSILIEVKFTYPFVSVSLYGLYCEYSRAARGSSRKIRRRHFRAFEQNVAQLKHWIHINSFVYDFHLTHLEKQLLDYHHHYHHQDMALQMCVGSNGVTPTPYSTNRLFSDVYHVRAAHSNFFQTLMKENERFGLRALGDDVLVDINHEKGDNNWAYTLVLCPTGCLSIQYFVLAVHQMERTPSTLAKNNWSASSQAKLLMNARKKIDAVVSKVIKTCHIRADWQQMMIGDNCCHHLLNKFHHVSLSKEPIFMRLINDINQYRQTTSVFDLFVQMYRDHCVQIDNHNLFFFHHITADYLIYVKKDEEEVEMWLVRQDFSSPTVSFTANEQQWLVVLGESLCYIFWNLCQH
ncbi:hypothetical protein BC941DRAFT_188139 [Chlamydoabsidia padenii]|nr:hypothetical protein BC941DRAFT_188139 [Chlamydoabsidia padenii]